MQIALGCHGKCMAIAGNLKYENKPVLERFPTPAPIGCIFNRALPNGITENWHTKYIVRKTWKPTILGIHNPTITFGISRNLNGEIVDGNSPFMKPIWDVAFVKHFITKSCEEFAERRFSRLDACGKKVAENEVLIENYFSLNEKTPEKEIIFNKALKNEENKHDK